jgi:hypothetical protein
VIPPPFVTSPPALLLVRSDYLHRFGTYTGTLPGGIELKEASGAREHHDTLW